MEAGAGAVPVSPPPRGIGTESEPAAMKPVMRRRRHPALGRARFGIVAIGAVFMVIGLSACADRRVRKAGTVREAASESLKWSAGVRAWVRSNSGQLIAVLIRTRYAIGAHERHALKAGGVNVISTSGDIVTGYLDCVALVRVSRFEFVRYVEMSRPLPVPHGRFP